jgi:SSS family solute:Na+ symporter
MSTLDSSLNTSATVWVMDFYRRRWNPLADERRLLRTTRLATVAVGSVGTLASLAMIEARTALDVWWEISAVLGGGMLGLFLLGLLVPEADSRSAALATGLGILVVAWGTYSGDLEAGSSWPAFPLHPMLLGLVGTATVLLSGWLLVRLGPVPLAADRD